jgi:hypothetical protein
LEKYLPSAHNTQVEFKSHFSGKGASYGPGNTVIRLKFCGIAECSWLISVIEPGFREYIADCLEPHSDA